MLSSSRFAIMEICENEPLVKGLRWTSETKSVQRGSTGVMWLLSLGEKRNSRFSFTFGWKALMKGAIFADAAIFFFFFFFLLPHRLVLLFLLGSLMTFCLVLFFSYHVLVSKCHRIFCKCGSKTKRIKKKDASPLVLQAGYAYCIHFLLQGLKKKWWFYTKWLKKFLYGVDVSLFSIIFPVIY